MQNLVTPMLTPLEQQLLAAERGELPIAALIESLIDAELFMPILEEQKIANFHASSQAKPLLLANEEGVETLVLFTSPERARDFVRDYPGYEGGLLAQLKWILARVGSGIALSLNPEQEVGIDLEANIVEQLAVRLQQDNNQRVN
ncbi:MAG: SseB family protein [Gammaproteobacteria bacterium]|nr:SseB family protein [Gammaproteobacteria bacterium]